MRDEVATLHERMSQGGDWMAFRNEIATLHAQDNTEEEYCELLRGHHLLMLMIDEVYDSETATKFHAIAEAEYRMFLNKEAMQGENINPVLLERVTRREIEAGRLAPESDFREFAVAGATVLGDSSQRGRTRAQSAVWGGVTLGLIVGIVLKFAMAGATWWTVFNAVLIGAAIGFVAELLPQLFALVTRRG